ncbi:MAG TPA: carotenoid 1,2-hydratase [Casimicrobiaceae bacterium]
MKRRAFLASPLLLLAASARGAIAYPDVVVGRALQFPRDYGSHPDFRIEWWYVTGWLEDRGGNASGFQVTFFRNRPGVAEENRSRFAPRELLFAHAAIADPRYGRLRYAQRAARAGFDLAVARESTTDVRIGDWSLRRRDGDYAAYVAAEDFALDLRFAPTQAVLLEGEAGFSRKGAGPRQASYYYSEPQLAVTGEVTTADRAAKVSGIAWLDHEWSSEYMAAEASGWDWTGINLDDGGALMAFRMRDRSGGALWAGGTHRTRDGRVRVFAPDEIEFAPQRRWRSPRTQVDYPVVMAVRAAELQCALEPLMDDQELDARAGTGTIYWEGAARAVQAQRAIGRGYLELTGYGKPLKL